MENFSFEEKKLAGFRKILQNSCFFFPKIDSTNGWLIAKQEKLEQGAIISTDFQTLGKGRLGRSWQAKSGLSLMFSVLYRPLNGFPTQFVSLSAAVAICDAFYHLGIQNISLKWPNDILYGQKKIGGILCEVFSDFLVIGIGINNLQESADFPEYLQKQASSLRIATGKKWSSFLLLERCTLQLDQVLQLLERKEPQEILKAWEGYCSPYKNITYTNPKTKEKRAGVIKGLNRENGNLLVLCENQKIENLSAGEITIQEFYQ
jgi:BirA family biotin operon repressor/biotin-[acetyl-CoA-carboxylase] ligase